MIDFFQLIMILVLLSFVACLVYVPTTWFRWSGPTRITVTLILTVIIVAVLPLGAIFRPY